MAGPRAPAPGRGHGDGGHRARPHDPRGRAARVGGEDRGPMSTEVLAAALAGCFCVAVPWGARKRRIPVERVRASVRPRRAVGEPRHGSYEALVRTSAPAEVIAPAVDLAKRYCWVTNTLRHPPEIAYRIEQEPCRSGRHRPTDKRF
ncbi:MAG: OsmC family protein [Actinomycetota bacterium]